MRTSKDQFSFEHPQILQHQMLDIFQTNEVPSVLKGAFPIRHKNNNNDIWSKECVGVFQWFIIYFFIFLWTNSNSALRWSADLERVTSTFA